jgi:hypothetical protein
MWLVWILDMDGSFGRLRSPDFRSYMMVIYSNGKKSCSGQEAPAQFGCSQPICASFIKYSYLCRVKSCFIQVEIEMDL